MDIEIEEDTKSIADYLQILPRHKYTILVPMVIFFVISVVVTVSLPAIFQSSTTISIEQQKIPTTFVKSTVITPIEERIEQIDHTALTVSKINEIIEKYKLYPTTKANPLELAQRFRANFEREPVTADIPGARKGNKITIGFKLTFNHPSPVVAQKTVNEISHLFLDENKKSRTNSASAATKFLEAESEKFRQEIEKTEKKIADYKKEYANSLPEFLSTYMAETVQIDNQLQQITAQEQIINEQKNALQGQISVTNPTPVVDENGKSVMPESLPTLKAEYARLLNKYSALHPDVIALKNKIKNFKKADIPADSMATNPVFVQLKGQLDMTDIQLANLTKQKERLNERLKTIHLQISQMPQVESNYSKLMRDLEGNQSQYKDLKEKFLEAKLSQTLEEEQQSEKFIILESANFPLKPEKPKRLQVLLIGIVGSIGVSIFIGIAVDIVQTGVRGYKSVAFLTQLPPLVTIPYIHNQADVLRERQKKIKFIILCVCLFFITVAIITTIYKPVGLIITNLLNKISVY